ncbi:formate/nitrite transporter family protein [Bacillus sp. B15-48]|uniref:formate/nitrite transporter family protein n=1 Tax=Bacillus sp. B15-48 TaxID=1548601 RepID=UPI00193FB408|nr:formate/nitrite transporter family protein [Bacillus sp. B15-48]MBM4761949.1 transporter [Bacillus sp. B15-48]
MSSKPINLAISSALKKKSHLEESKIKYLLSAALAGVYIGFGIVVSYRLAESFFVANSPATYLMSSLFFGIALVIIIYGRAELFTGNTMLFTMSTLARKTTIRDTIKNWTASYTGNLLGACFFAVLIALTGLFSSPEKSQFMMEAVTIKMTTPGVQLFFRAILCNWLVCLAAYWIPYHLKGDGAKLSATLLIVFAFVVSGFEHSIANMALFLIALFVPHPETVTIFGFFHNLIPVTLGNIIGGGLFVGGLHMFLFSSTSKQSNGGIEEPASRPFRKAQ